MQTKALNLSAFQVRDAFWGKRMQLVEREMLPYQWEVLNDRVPEAPKSWCVRNFTLAAKKKRDFVPGKMLPRTDFYGWEILPEDPEKPQDRFYGFVFQDSDLYKWTEACAYGLLRQRLEEGGEDAYLRDALETAVGLIEGAQREDGYLDTLYEVSGWRPFTNLRNHHELYCFGHLTEAAVAVWKCLGDRRLLDAAGRFADFIAEHLGKEEGKLPGYPGHEIAEMALAALYDVTGEEKYLRLASYFVDERGQSPVYFGAFEEHPDNNDTYLQAHKPVRAQDEAVGHAVRAVYLYSGMADVAKRTGDETLLAACRKLWDSITREKLYITGGIGATKEGEAFSVPYDLPNDLAYAETCASVGLIFFARRLLEQEQDSRYADVMELALSNTVLAGMAEDGKSFFYVNPLEVDPRACREDVRKNHVKPVRQKWFGCACCPPNLARLLLSLPAYAFTESEDALFVHLYLGGRLEKKVQTPEGEDTLVLAFSSGLPADGTFAASVEKGCRFPCTIGIRIPWWASKKDYPELPGKERRIENGYLLYTGRFEDGEELRLDFGMEARFMEASARVSADTGKLALMRGPFVYCAEEADNGGSLAALRVRADADAVEGSLRIGRTEVQTLTVPGYREEEGKTLYRLAGTGERTETEIRLIPYFAWANRGENEMRVWIGRA